MIYDSVRVAASKKRLMNTQLFSKVDIVALQKEDGVHAYIVVKELFYYYPDGGGDIIFGRYGNDKDVWYRLRLGLTKYNFRGRFETVSFGTSVWEDRSVSVSWSKPFVPSLYFCGLGASIEDYPDLSFPRRRLTASGKVYGGKYLFLNSKTWVSFAPTYTRIDSLDNPSNVKYFKEAFTAVGWSTDRKDRSFDPSKGWSLYCEMLTNALYSGNNPDYLQLRSDIRLYHRGFFPTDRVAYRLQSVVRTNDAGPYQGVYMGGEGSLRGFGRDQFGRSAIMNDFAILSMEYRFTLYPTPEYDIPVLCNYISSCKGFFIRTDGAFILDAGHIWRDVLHPFVQRENGAGVGAGLRFLAPTFLRSVCFDVVWGIPGTSNPQQLSFSAVPSWYFYLDMYY
jgi:outer membrane protein assembly factor BamA